MTTETPLVRPAHVITFIIAALTLSCAICSGQFIAWSLEQSAIISASAAALAHAGWISLGAQGLILLAVTGALYGVFRQSPLGPIYQGWFIASLLAFPALILRFLGPNQDQVGAMLQIGLATLAGIIILIVRRRALQFNFRPALAAFAAAPLAILPFLIYGSPGSGPDLALNLLAGLAFGLLAASLISTTAGNYLLNALGVSVLLTILGSELGYDGGQLLLLAILPPFGLAIAALSPSTPAAAIGVGLLAAAPLIFIDPTELALVLQDFLPWAIRICLFVILLELVIGAGLWVISRWQPSTRSGRAWTIALPLAAALLAWAGAFGVYFAFGQRGFHGDRLFVILKDQADVSSAVSISDRTDRLTYVYQTLTTHANATQADLRKTLDRFGVRYKPYYLVNALEVEGGTLARLYLATRPEVDRVIASPRLRPLPEPGAASSGSLKQPLAFRGWNIEFIGADRVWDEFGVTGQNIVIGNSDTGVQGDHPALRDSYRGLTAGDDYNWYDPWEGSSSPNDQQSHGTHTTGTILGGGGIGVAPGAKWIACVNLERNLGNPALYLDCLQFMLAPFPQNGDPFADGDPTKAAHVLNNSWGCPPIEGCDAQVLEPAADALRAAGIFVVVSTGNDGPACSTVNAPLALYDSVFSVGAMDRGGDLAPFSSRGPVTVDGSGRLKPDIVAPGVNIVSSTPGNTYEAFPGTSMAGPHVVGVVALLWSADPELIGDIERTEQILRETARPYTGMISEHGGCDDLPLPNNGVGAGIIDAYAAVKMALGK